MSRRPGRSFAVSTLVLLFFLEGIRLFHSAIFIQIAATIEPGGRVVSLLGAVASLPLVLLAALPLSRLLGRAGAVTASALLVAGARLAATLPSPEPRLLAAALVLAGGTLYLGSAAGYVEARALAAALPAAVLLDELLRVYGWSYDPGMGPRWLPVQAALSAVLVVLLAPGSGRGAWPAAAEGGPSGLERRAGGLRLRGGLALGALLFLETSVLSSAAVVSRWTGLAYPFSALLLLLGATGATALLLSQPRPPGARRGTALAFGLAAGCVPALALLLPGVARAAGGWPAGIAFGLAHGCALLLAAWALTPAGGRRGEWTALVGLLLLMALTTVYAASFFPGFTLGALAGAAPWTFLAAALVVLAALLLFPRPGGSAPPAGGRAVAAAAVAVVAVAAFLLFARGGPARPSPVTAGAGLRVATYNVHWGVGPTGVFDPRATARQLAASGAQVVALQEVPAGLPTLYGVDLALWIERRLRTPVRFAPAVNGLLGDALLSRLPVERFRVRRLPDRGRGRDGGERVLDPRVVVSAVVGTGGRPLEVRATRLGTDADSRAAQLPVLLDALGMGPVVLLGDLNAGADSPVDRALVRAGLDDAFEQAGVPPAATAPASRPRLRLDWIRVRGYGVVDAAVLPGAASDHRLVRATLEASPPGG